MDRKTLIANLRLLADTLEASPDLEGPEAEEMDLLTIDTGIALLKTTTVPNTPVETVLTGIREYLLDQ